MENYIGTRLLQARKLKKITQEQLSDLTDVSVSEISRIENGKNSTTVDTLLKFCNVLDVGLDYMLYDYFPADTNIVKPEIQQVVFIMESMDTRHLKYIADIITLYCTSHLE